MRFGNTFAAISRGIAVMTLLGLITGGICVMASIWHHTIAAAWPVCVLLTLTPPAIFFVACVPTLALSVYIEGGRVKHMFLDRFVLSDLPVADFERVEWLKRPFPVKIVFTENRRIQFFGAHLGIVGALNAALESAKKRANQTPEPTPLLVTDRADARSAPSKGVAHL